MGESSWRDTRAWLRWALVGILAAAAGATGLAGSFVHRAARPAGIALALAAVVAVMVLTRATARSRWGLGIVGAAWLIPAGVMASGTPAGDIVIASDAVGLTFLLGGVVITSVFVGWGVGPPRPSHDQAVPERAPVG